MELYCSHRAQAGWLVRLVEPPGLAGHSGRALRSSGLSDLGLSQLIALRGGQWKRHLPGCLVPRYQELFRR